jgi:hypothetical protein
MAPLTPTTNCADQEVAMSFDWLPEVQDRYAIFQVRLRRGERHSWFNINLDLGRLSKPDLEQVQSILVRRQNELSEGREIASAISWLLAVASAQEGFSKEERKVRIRELMLFWRTS